MTQWSRQYSEQTGNTLGCFWLFCPFAVIGLLLFSSDLTLDDIALSMYLRVLAVLLFTVWWISAIVTGIRAIVAMVNLRVHGVRVTGTVLSTRTKERTSSDDDGRTTSHTSYYAEVGYIVGAERHVVEIGGMYTAGDLVPIVYHPDNPQVVAIESSISKSKAVGCGQALVVFAVVGFAILTWIIFWSYSLLRSG